MKTAQCFSAWLSNAKDCKNEGKHKGMLTHRAQTTPAKKKKKKSKTFHVSVEIGAGIVLSVWLLTE